MSNDNLRVPFERRFVVWPGPDGGHQAIRLSPGAQVVARGPIRDDELDARCDLLMLRTWAVITRTDPGPDSCGRPTDAGQIRTAAGLRRGDMSVVLEDGTELAVVLSIGALSKRPSLSPDESLVVVAGPTAGGSYLTFKFDPSTPLQ